MNLQNRFLGIRRENFRNDLVLLVAEERFGFELDCGVVTCLRAGDLTYNVEIMIIITNLNLNFYSSYMSHQAPPMA